MMEKFDVKTTKLESTNLIEASAGTGKTFSIALLVIRMIVEKGMEIRNILMVTFTNAAVAELESRIRDFIRMSHDYLETGISDELPDDLVAILNRAKKLKGAEDVKSNLYRSILYLDETAIYTIHSFCQRTLTEFAFETNQAFENEIASDSSPYVEEAVKKFWRERVTVIEPGLLLTLINNGLSIQDLKGYAADHLSNEDEVSFSKEEVDLFLKSILESTERVEETWGAIPEYYDENREIIIQSSNSGGQKRSFAAIADQKDAFLDKYQEMLNMPSPRKYMDTFLPDLKLLFEDYASAILNLSENVGGYISYLRQEALLFSSTFIDKKKKHQGILFYDDLIKNLYLAVKGPNRKLLVEELNKKYHAVFIDEFHDTDNYQYEIFSILFRGHCPVFLIGDPKQSIYAWRGADIETYKKAAKEADYQYTMYSNYRSTAKYIEAMNAIYSAASDPFCDPDIGYIEVEHGRDVGQLKHKEVEVLPIGIIQDTKKEDAYVRVAEEINELLTGEYFIKKEHIRPSDIAVLVRSNFETPGIKRELVKLGIPAITNDDTRVLLTEEARDVFYILKAILDPKKSDINRALATPFTGKTTKELLSLDDRAELERFLSMLETLNKQGIYGALMQFASNYQVKRKCLENINGERVISNFLQTAELLQKRQIEKGQTPEQLMTWMQRIFEGELTSGDEYEQRVESDENAVTITTIHRSKGLAYNIVFAPFLNMKIKDDVAAEEDDEHEVVLVSPQEQENRRLMYVALTRAVYKCYINITSSSKGQGSIHSFESEIMSLVPSLAERIEEQDKPLIRYASLEENKPSKPQTFGGKINTSWRILSYSGLSKSHKPLAIEDKPDVVNGYDEFVFSLLPRGIVAGLFLHEIFENIDFTNHSTWEIEIKRTANKYGVAIGTNLPLYTQMITNILNANYSFGPEKFVLSSLPLSGRINELEFYFSLDGFKAGELNKIMSGISIDSYSYEGAMHGYVDLFFEMNGKYYVLDWKSNYLGNTVEQYSADSLEQAMTANNYHLQYLVYTIAVKRFLENRIADFDYDKHFGGIYYVFLRGCRVGEESGLFYTKPEIEMIEKIDSIFSSAEVR